ncbi:dethiobiotin synthase [Polynucleobacter sp. AP-Kolm-20A-A1]|uniref:dethiobiotin synthase n=1 Tax=Polynucleobacter sp. AP-Kolm-20A-A1 TaxID=2081041 RepID=UPI001BFEE304|nr:dethiobiotin synthase [Polynucleobacter sp. AP-Kolm-20A-A1]QWE20770.1 dethiobiotin synthase [Polynucleobacter sp. AP-Kolm-20A-A1]
MSFPTGFFITGTDTEVGKTLVSGALILKMRAQGKKAIGFKPVVAGTYQDIKGAVLNEDLETLRIASNLNPGQLDLCPYVLDMPAAPHLVAASIGQELEINRIMQALAKVQSQSDVVVAEGAGGFLIPLNKTQDLADVAKEMNLPIILVVGMKLGCLNHALLTYEAMVARKLNIAGWVANTLASEMPLLQENIETLKTRIKAPFLGLIPALPKQFQKSIDSPYSIEALEFAAQHIQLPKN